MTQDVDKLLEPLRDLRSHLVLSLLGHSLRFPLSVSPSGLNPDSPAFAERREYSNRKGNNNCNETYDNDIFDRYPQNVNNNNNNNRSNNDDKDEEDEEDDKDDKDARANRTDHADDGGDPCRVQRSVLSRVRPGETETDSLSLILLAACALWDALGSRAHSLGRSSKGRAEAVTLRTLVTEAYVMACATGAFLERYAGGRALINAKGDLTTSKGSNSESIRATLASLAQHASVTPFSTIPTLSDVLAFCRLHLRDNGEDAVLVRNTVPDNINERAFSDSIKDSLKVRSVGSSDARIGGSEVAAAGAPVRESSSAANASGTSMSGAMHATAQSENRTSKSTSIPSVVMIQNFVRPVVSSVVIRSDNAKSRVMICRVYGSHLPGTVGTSEVSAGGDESTKKSSGEKFLGCKVILNGTEFRARTIQDGVCVEFSIPPDKWSGDKGRGNVVIVMGDSVASVPLRAPFEYDNRPMIWSATFGAVHKASGDDKSVDMEDKEKGNDSQHEQDGAYASDKNNNNGHCKDIAATTECDREAQEGTDDNSSIDADGNIHTQYEDENTLLTVRGSGYECADVFGCHVTVNDGPQITGEFVAPGTITAIVPKSSCRTKTVGIVVSVAGIPSMQYVRTGLQ